MSQVNAPIPTGTGPAEVFDSTASAPHGATISAIGMPAGPPQETPMHTGMFNTIDIVLREQYVPIDTITWSVTQTAGTLMWKRPIHPRFCHEGIAYLMGLYNCWSGGLDFNFKVAGTGFHAGAIAIVRIPPNLRPEDFTTPSSWGLFEYVVIDPKTLEVESLGVSDQRPIMYHYKNFREEDPMTFGGWIAMYTLLSLNTSSTGSQQIQIQAFSKPSVNWQPSQTIMPGFVKSDPIFPLEYASDFDFSAQPQVLSTFPRYCTNLLLFPKAIKSINAVTNCSKINGEPMSQYNVRSDLIETVNDSTPYTLTFDTIVNENSVSIMRFGRINEPGVGSSRIKPLGVPVVNYPPRTAVELATQKVHNFDLTKGVTWEAVQNVVRWSFAETVESEMGTGLFFCDRAQMPETWSDRTYAPPIAGESPLVFCTVNGTTTSSRLYGAQTRRLTRLFASGILDSVIPSNMCILFTLIDVSEDLPLGFVKLYREGFFTMNSPEAETYFNITNMKLVFNSFILRTDQIPKKPEMATNRLLRGVTLPQKLY